MKGEEEMPFRPVCLNKSGCIFMGNIWDKNVPFYLKNLNLLAKCLDLQIITLKSRQNGERNLSILLKTGLYFVLTGKD